MKIPKDYPVQPLKPGQHAKDRMTCGTCGRAWDDGIVTGMTPTPGARCPFEAFHGAERKPAKRAVDKPKRVGGTCPNCTSNVANHAEDGCVLAALVQVIRERGNVPERKLRQLHAKVDVDALWNDLGRVIDRLEEGHYS